MAPVNRARMSLIGLVLTLAFPAAGFGQQRSAVSDEEIRQFAAAVSDVREIQSRMEQEINEIIEESPLSRERFMEILEDEEAAELSEGEQQAFDAAVQQISASQSRLQESLRQAVSESGLTPQRFDEILTALQVDPTLAERLRPYLESAQ